MTRNHRRVGVVASVVGVWILTAALAAQTPAGQAPIPKVKAVASPPITSIEGKDNFDAYCAVCHGADAKGQGPAAPAMKKPVPDLTGIARRNGGKFDALRVEMIIKGTGKTATPAHGVETMPIWGEVFKAEDPGKATLRVKNLVDYIQSIQVRPAS